MSIGEMAAVALLRVTLAGLAGAALGEIEARQRLRQHSQYYEIVAVGISMATSLAVLLVENGQGPSRLPLDPSELVSGLVFPAALVGGSWMWAHQRDPDALFSGLMIWTTAAIGIVFGLGLYVAALIATILAGMILTVRGRPG